MPSSSKHVRDMTPVELDRHIAKMTPAELKAFAKEMDAGIARNRAASVARGEKQIDFGAASVEALKTHTKNLK